ncbi:MAG: hypothetical protein NVSMB31_01380 [Vulcanimicrobiaceae bacterium]
MSHIREALERVGIERDEAERIARQWEPSREPVTTFLERLSVRLWDAAVELGGGTEFKASA